MQGGSLCGSTAGVLRRLGSLKRPQLHMSLLEPANVRTTMHRSPPAVRSDAAAHLPAFPRWACPAGLFAFFLSFFGRGALAAIGSKRRCNIVMRIRQATTTAGGKSRGRGLNTMHGKIAANGETGQRAWIVTPHYFVCIFFFFLAQAVSVPRCSNRDPRPLREPPRT